MCITKSFEVWLENSSERDVSLQSCELFGFGPGVCTESPLGTAVLRYIEIVGLNSNAVLCADKYFGNWAGTARTQAGSSWPWVIDHDKD